MHSHEKMYCFRSKEGESLNPCCNGRCTRTAALAYRKFGAILVLILVVMEDALAPDENDVYTKGETKVLILVVMEDALARCRSFCY